LTDDSRDPENGMHAKLEEPMAEFVRRPTLPSAGVAASGERARLRTTAPPEGRPPSSRPTPVVSSTPLTVGETLPILYVMNGVEGGRVIRIGDQPMVLGRDPLAHVYLEEPTISRAHAQVARGDDGAYYLRDLDSTNGTRLGGSRVRIARLDPGDLVQLGPSLLLRFERIDRETLVLRESLHEASIRDGLTRVYNRRYFVERLKAEIAEAVRSDTALSLLMIDVDNFKTFNDRWGHLPGDRSLSFIAAQLSRISGQESVVARWGGDEFVVLSRVGRADATMAAERLRRGVATLPFSISQNPVWLTVSIGVACLSELQPGDEPAALLALADERMYAAKVGGRNCVRGS
jgi:two-component system cell cycle response regulator